MIPSEGGIRGGYVLVGSSPDGIFTVDFFSSDGSCEWPLASSENGFDERFDGRFLGRALAICVLSIWMLWLRIGLRSTSKSSGLVSFDAFGSRSADADGSRTEDVTGVLRAGRRSVERAFWPELVRDRIGIRSGMSGGRRMTHSVLVLGAFVLRVRIADDDDGSG